MSFHINWPEFDKEFISLAKAQLQKALNSGKKPDSIHGSIDVTCLSMGTKAPDLEILEITELVADRFKGIFKLVYHGDASLDLETKVQANPLYVPPRSFLHPVHNMLMAHKPLVVPMKMKISQVVDKQKGITLVFKNDPLEQVLVSSTFDNIPSIKRLLQSQIEKQLRVMFQDELPLMIHNLSLLMLKKNQIVHDSGMIELPIQKEELGALPHHKKWQGNDEEDQNHYVLYRSLSVGEHLQGELGLHKIIDETRPHVPRLEKHDNTGKRLKQKDVFVPIGFPKQQEPDYIQRVHLFLDQSNMFHIPDDDFLDRGEDKLSVWSVPLVRDMNDTMNSSLHYNSPPQSIHKGKRDALDWHRPIHQSHTKPISKQTTAPNTSTASVLLQNKILLTSDNENTAHLANLMQSHLTMSPYTREYPHFVFKSKKDDLETKSMSGLDSKKKNKRGTRRVYRVTVPKGIFTLN